jgi:hypothetical protein
LILLNLVNMEKLLFGVVISGNFIRDGEFHLSNSPQLLCLICPLAQEISNQA